MSRLSVIIPTLNAEAGLGACLSALVSASVRGTLTEVLVVDAGSEDKTKEIADAMGTTFLKSDKGRGVQLRLGGEKAKGDWLLFLHADSWLAPDWEAVAARHMDQQGDKAGFFSLQYRSNAKAARWLEARANRRARWFGLPYGDQGLLISQSLYSDIGGYKALPLMEDVDIARRLGKSRLTLLPTVISTSAEKYERDGWRKRAYANAFLLTRYLAGADVNKLARVYY